MPTTGPKASPSTFYRMYLDSTYQHVVVSPMLPRRQPSRSPLTPLFAAFPYVFAVSPLSTAFTHFDRVGGVSFFLCSRFSFTSLPLRVLPTPLLPVLCRLLGLSLQRKAPSFSLFSATYRHFLQKEVRATSATFQNGEVTFLSPLVTSGEPLLDWHGFGGRELPVRGARGMLRSAR